MRTIDAVAEILKREGINILPSFPTTPVIEAAAAAGIKPIICRQERVGVGIADGWSRVKNGKPAGAFAMQYGPGAENAYAGVATAFSDALPMLLLPLGPRLLHARGQERVPGVAPAGAWQRRGRDERHGLPLPQRGGPCVRGRVVAV